MDAWLVGEVEIELCLDTGGGTVAVGGLIGGVVGFCPGRRRVPVSVIIPPCQCILRGSIGDLVGWDALDDEPVVPVGGI